MGALIVIPAAIINTTPYARNIASLARCVSLCRKTNSHHALSYKNAFAKPSCESLLAYGLSYIRRRAVLSAEFLVHMDGSQLRTLVARSHSNRAAGGLTEGPSHDPGGFRNHRRLDHLHPKGGTWHDIYRNIKGRAEDVYWKVVCSVRTTSTNS